MRTAVFGMATAIGLVLANPPAHAIGCLTGGAAGALAGHYAGHGILGAIGGCIAGHAYHKHQLNNEALQSQQSYDQARRAQNPNYRSPWTQ